MPKDVTGAGAYRVTSTALKSSGGSMLYSYTPEGKIRLHRDLSKWRKPGTANEYFSEAPGPKERAQEKEFAALISRSTKELNLDQECAVAVKNMKRQEYLDQLAEI